MKFGGTSVGSIDKIYNVANIIQKESSNNKLIVVFYRQWRGKLIRMQKYIDEIQSVKKLKTTYY